MAEPPPSPSEILASLEDTLNGRLPPDWSIDLAREPSLAERYRPDAVLSVIAPDGTTGRLVVELKTAILPKDVSAIRNQLTQYQIAGQVSGSLVATRYLTQRTRELLKADGLSYADATGNVRVAIPRPPFYIELDGADTNPWVETRPLKSLAGASSAAVARALLDFKPPYSVSDLAARAGLELSTVSRAVSLLVDEAIVTREPRGPIAAVDWEALLRRWAVDYDLFRSNESRAGFEPRGVDTALGQLWQLRGRWAITGSVAAQARMPTAPAALLTVYVEGSVRRAAIELGLRETVGPSNVVLLEPRSKLPFERSWMANGRRYVAISQVAVDLLTGPGRSPSEAEMLIDWMRRNEDDWRSS